MNRLLAVARLHTVVWPAVVGWPWIILASSFALNLVTFAVIGDKLDENPTTGGLASLYVTVLVVGVGLVTQAFPVAAGLSVTRREFYAATSLYGVAQAIAFAVPLYLLKVVEQATGGWGVSLSFFGVPFLSVGNGFVQVLIYAVPLLLASFLGTLIGVVYTRWSNNGVFTMVTITLLGLGLAAVLVTWRDAWTDLGHWFTRQSPVGLLAGWPALLALLLAGGGYLILRRTPAA